MTSEEIYAAQARMMPSPTAPSDEWLAGFRRFTRFCAGLPDEGGIDYIAVESSPPPYDISRWPLQVIAGWDDAKVPVKP